MRDVRSGAALPLSRDMGAVALFIVLPLADGVALAEMQNHGTISSAKGTDMQTAVQVICKRGPSLRKLIGDQYRKLEGCNFTAAAIRKHGRNPGWLKVKSTEPGVWGALNLAWDPGTRTLTCRCVNRRLGTPHQIIGRFLDFLLRYHSLRIKVISIFQA